MSDQIVKITEFYQAKTGLTLRGFAESLNEKLVDTSVSHVSVGNWQRNQAEPATDFLTLVVMRYRDWRFDWALDCLAAKLPEVWGVPGGGVWAAAQELERRSKAE